MPLETGVSINLYSYRWEIFKTDYLGAETRLFLVFDVGDLLKKKYIFYYDSYDPKFPGLVHIFMMLPNATEGK